MKGSSGASLAVIKTADTPHGVRRLHAQFDWLERHEGDHLVRVYEKLPFGYTMEYLEPSQLSLYDFLFWVRRPLEKIWQSMDNTFATWRPNAYVLNVHGGSVLWDWWYSIIGGEGFVHLTCNTHGDPTYENVMARAGRAVLIDPLPDATQDGKVPSIRALDLGKVLQSGLHYEEVKIGRRASWEIAPWFFREVRHWCNDRVEWQLACWCCALHVARFIPYQRDNIKEMWMKTWPQLLASLRSISTVS